MVRRNLGLPHRLISKNFNCVIWVEVKDIQHPALLEYLKSRKVENQTTYLKEIHYQINWAIVIWRVFQWSQLGGYIFLVFC